MADYVELFISRWLSQSAYTAVIYDHDKDAFYDALFESVQCGGGCSFRIRKSGTPITLRKVRELADRAEDSRAGRYLGITEDNWCQFVFTK